MDRIEIEGFGGLDVTMVDVVNPCIFVRATDIGFRGDETPEELDANPEAAKLIDQIRTRCAELMGLADWKVFKPIPFLAFVSSSKDYTNYLTGETIRAGEVDFLTRMVLLGKMHKTYAGSVACVTGAAAVIKGSIVNEAAKLGEGRQNVRLGHPAGIIDVSAEVKEEADGPSLKRITYGRTARRLMEGYVFVPNYALEK